MSDTTQQQPIPETISRRDLEFNAHLGGLEERAKAEAQSTTGEDEQVLLRAALAGPLTLSDGTEIHTIDGAFLILLNSISQKAENPEWKWLQLGGFDEATLCWLILNPQAAYDLIVCADDAAATKTVIFQFAMTKSIGDFRKLNDWVNLRLKALRSKGADVPK